MKNLWHRLDDIERAGILWGAIILGAFPAFYIICGGR